MAVTSDMASRVEIRVAEYGSQVVGGYLVSCRVGPHSFDYAWPWWTPWDAFEQQDHTRDGRHPSLTRTPLVHR